MLTRRIAVLGALAATTFTSAAFAGSPHFIRSQTEAGLIGSSLFVEFKEAGLESGSVETITISATEQIAYECVNNGGSNPAASNKKTFRTTGSDSGEFSADRNGNIVGSLTLEPATAASLGFSCPPGQTVTFVSVTYSNIVILDEDTGARLSLNGTFSYTNPDAPPVR